MNGNGLGFTPRPQSDYAKFPKIFGGNKISFIVKRQKRSKRSLTAPISKFGPYNYNNIKDTK
jgi:hypothetical protein